jgi:hypothetical protein
VTLLLEIRFCTEVPSSFDFLTRIPSVCKNDPGKKRSLAIEPFGHRPVAVWPIPTRPHRGSAGGLRVGDQGLTYYSSGAVGGSRVAPAGSVGGGGRRRLLRPILWQGGDVSRAMSKCLSFSRT